MMTLELDEKKSGYLQIISQSANKGNQIKYCNGDLWFKGDSYGYEGLAEVICSEILSISNLKIDQYVKYNLATFTTKEGKLLKGCSSKHFLKHNESFITIGKLIKDMDIDEGDLTAIPLAYKRKIMILEYVKKETNLYLEEYLANCFALDCIVRNEDRHLYNIGVIYNTKTRKYGLAPIFDNGLSLLSDIADYKEDEPLESCYNRVKARPLTRDFEEQLSLFKPTLRIDKNKYKELVDSIESERIKYVLIQGYNRHQNLFV